MKTFLLLSFLDLNLSYSFTEGFQCLFQRKLFVTRFERGQTFSRGGPTLSRVGGTSANFYKKPLQLVIDKLHKLFYYGTSGFNI